MRYRTRFVDLAQEDLNDITDYLTELSSQTALTFIDELEQRLSIIKDFPEIFPIYTYDERFRKIIIGKYLIFYIVDHKNRINNVIRILYSAMDIKSELAKIKSIKGKNPTFYNDTKKPAS